MRTPRTPRPMREACDVEALELEIEVRRGISYWWSGYRCMVRWEFIDIRRIAVFAIVIQFVIGALFVLGVGLFFDDIPARSAQYLTTGAFVVSLITVAMVAAPQMIAAQKMAQQYDYRWSLPVPRSAATLAWFTVALAIGLPGAIVALAVGAARYGVTYDLSVMIVPAVLVGMLTAGLIGFAMALTLKPMVATMLATTLLFVVLGFAPINFPPENLPGWLANLNLWLPFYPMAVVIRSALLPGEAGNVAQSYLVLAVWAVGCGAAVVWTIGRRK